MYYSDWNRERPVIGRFRPDGTGREDFVTEGLHLPNGLAVLHGRRELCWVDAGAQHLACVPLNDPRHRRVDLCGRANYLLQIIQI